MPGGQRQAADQGLMQDLQRQLDGLSGKGGRPTCPSNWGWKR